MATRLSSQPGSRYNQAGRWSPGRAFAHATSAATLTLVKVVSNTHGGTALPSAWTLTASGPSPLFGAGGASGTVTPGTYVLGESAGPSGYVASSWVCTGGTQVANQVTIADGQDVVCTITNRDTDTPGPTPTPPTPTPSPDPDCPLDEVTYHAIGEGAIPSAQIKPAVREYVSQEPKEPLGP